MMTQPTLFDGIIQDVNYAVLICRTCSDETRLLLTRPQDLDESITELGHEGHDWIVEEE